MIQRLAHTAVLVGDYDEALAWYTDKLGLEVRTDTLYGKDYRWITVGAPGQVGVDIALHLAATDGSQLLPPFGTQPALILTTDDCHRETRILRDRGVFILRDPIVVAWGIEALIEDPYGNVIALVQP
jgi:catechol 2,3-dioxygenase-like lactoylglutathione lyase family enzyme